VGFNLNRLRLEIYVDILQVLSRNGPLSLSQVMREAHLSSNALRGYLNLLVQEGLIEKRIAAKRSQIYSVNPNGTNVVEYFGESKKAFPSFEETQKGFSKSSN
jgi:predicted transcriptional regulator